MQGVATAGKAHALPAMATRAWVHAYAWVLQRAATPRVDPHPSRRELAELRNSCTNACDQDDRCVPRGQWGSERLALVWELRMRCVNSNTSLLWRIEACIPAHAHSSARATTQRAHPRCVLCCPQCDADTAWTDIDAHASLRMCTDAVHMLYRNVENFPRCGQWLHFRCPLPGTSASGRPGPACTQVTHAAVASASPSPVGKPGADAPAGAGTGDRAGCCGHATASSNSPPAAAASWLSPRWLVAGLAVAAVVAAVVSTRLASR